MQPRQCAGCGAPLPHTDTAGVVTCRFCGMAHDPDPRRRRPDVVVRVPPGAARSAVRVGGLVAALIGLVIGVVGLAIGVAAWRIGSRPPVNLTPVEKTTITAADLAAAPARRLTLVASAPRGGYAALDAVLALPWALSLAQQWAPDAALERIDVERLRPDGTVNAADDPQGLVRYRFQSPERIRQLRLEGRTTSTASAVVELHLGVSGGTPYVQGIGRSASGVRAEDRPPHPDVAALRMLVPRLVENEPYRAPFLKGYLIHIDAEGWAWLFGTLSGESMPRVRATDGQPWPYPRADAPARPTRRR